MKITGKYLLQQLELANNCKFTTTDFQRFRLDVLATHPSVQALTEDEIETLVDGEYDDQEAIARRSTALTELGLLLNEIFNSI